jgi:hypothetical protein
MTKEKGVLKQISEGTLIPLSLAITVIGGGATWMTTIASKQEAIAARVDRQGDFMREVRNTMLEMNQRLSNIEGKLEYITTNKRSP